MEDHTPVDKPISNWAVAGGLLAFAAAYLLWAIGFDIVCGWLAGTWVETVLTWVTNFWYWVAIGVFIVTMIAAQFRKS